MNNKNVISRNSKLDDNNYKWGFDFDFNPDNAPKGLSEDIVNNLQDVTSTQGAPSLSQNA